MPGLVRFSVSLEKKLLSKFDRRIKEEDYPTRSKAIGDLIAESLIKEEWIQGKEVTGAIVLVYDHHRRELVTKLTDIQHDFHDIVVSTQHIHLDRRNCLEIVAVRGNPTKVKTLARKLKATKGVKHSSLATASTGKEI